VIACAPRSRQRCVGRGWSSEKQEETTERLEALGKLQVQKEASGRTVALSRLRGVNRPIIIAGSSSHVKQALREAQGFKAEFDTRGIIIVRAAPAQPICRALVYRRESYCVAHGCTHGCRKAPPGLRFSAKDPRNSAFLDSGRAAPAPLRITWDTARC
jgi:hypothetical protein